MDPITDLLVLERLVTAWRQRAEEIRVTSLDRIPHHTRADAIDGCAAQLARAIAELRGRTLGCDTETLSLFPEQAA